MQKPIDAYNNVLELVGNTPLVKLNRIVSHIPGAHYAKVEAFNPGHSAKDRIAIFIIEEAERKGILKKEVLSLRPHPVIQDLASLWLV